VVSRWPDEREATSPRRFDRGACREERRLGRRPRRRRVGIEPRQLVDGEDVLDV
jgi:hypothetical protein